MVFTEHFYPDKQVKVEGVDVSNDAISTRVELIENGIPMCTLTANNEDGINFLSNLVLNNIVEVKFVQDSTPPTAVNWAAVDVCFRGTIQELAPSISNKSQICKAVAFGYGFQTKQMRVSSQYGYGAVIPIYQNTFGFVNQIKEWSTIGNSPWLQAYANDFMHNIQDTQSYIYLNLSGNLGKYIGAFNFGLSPISDNMLLAVAELHIVAGIYDTGAPPVLP